MFCTPQLAARIDRAEGRMCASMARAMTDDALALPVGGGVAVYAGATSPMNKLIGAGFEGAVVEEEYLRTIEEQFAARRTRLQGESPRLPPPICTHYCARAAIMPSVLRTYWDIRSRLSASNSRAWRSHRLSRPKRSFSSRCWCRPSRSQIPAELEAIRFRRRRRFAGGFC